MITTNPINHWSLRAASAAMFMLLASCGHTGTAGAPNAEAANTTSPTPPAVRHNSASTEPAAGVSGPATGPAARGNATGGAAAATTRQADGPTSRPFGEHWVQDWRVRAIMQTIAVGANPNWPKRLPQEPETKPSPEEVRKALDDAALIADNLAIAAGQIPAAIEDRPIPEDVRAGFLEQARRLHDQALRLKEDAREGRVEQMQHTLDAINQTCFRCHTRYRDLTDVMTPGRAERTGETRDGRRLAQRISLDRQGARMQR